MFRVFVYRDSELAYRGPAFSQPEMSTTALEYTIDGKFRSLPPALHHDAKTGWELPPPHFKDAARLTRSLLKELELSRDFDGRTYTFELVKV